MSRMSYRNRIILIACIVFVCVALDQATKRLAIAWLKGMPPHIYLGDIFRFQYAENTGAFLGLFGQLSGAVRTVLLVGFNSIILTVVSVFLFTSREMQRLVAVALALILAGGVGNLIDRVLYGGHVVDFMNLGLPWLTIRGWEPRTGIFNIADLAIVGGLLLMILAEILRARSEAANGAPAADSAEPRDESARS